MTIILSSSTTTKLSFSYGFRQQNPLISSRLFTGFTFTVNDNKRHRRVSLSVSCGIKNQPQNRTTEKSKGKIGARVLSEGRDEDERYAPICPGCGVFMQDRDQNLPGFYQKRMLSLSDAEEDGYELDYRALEDEHEVLDEEDKGEVVDIEDEDEVLDDDDDDDVLDDDDDDDDDDDEGFSDGEIDKVFRSKADELDWDADELEAKLLGEDKDGLDLDGFKPAGVGYGNVTEEWLAKIRKEKVTKSEKKIAAREEARKENAVSAEVTVCARCHSLRNYGQVKNHVAENLIPDFDFDRLISTRMVKPPGSSSQGNVVVIMVVDCVDFEGSFPKRAARSLFEALDASKDDPRAAKRLPKLVLVATKVDLLPSQISPARLDRWVRGRARAAGAPKLSGVYLVSSRKDLGVRNLLSFVKDLAGPRGNVWVIGAQNAGKSTLINLLAKKEGVKISKLTEAPVPGTTLGILRVGGILPAKAKLFDTPGLLHPYLVSMKLEREEQKMVEIRKELQPRSYRMKVGQTIHVGGLMRVDLIQASVDTIYVTVWASANVSLHMGKLENAEETWTKHVGIRLQPPIGVERSSEIGKLQEREIKVSGISWDVNSIDISAAGLGWISLGLKGEATLRLWTLDGVEITQREPLVLDRARSLERPGFWLPKAISEAIGSQTKLEAKLRKLQEEEDEESSLLELSS